MKAGRAGRGALGVVVMDMDAGASALDLDLLHDAAGNRDGHGDGLTALREARRHRERGGKLPPWIGIVAFGNGIDEGRAAIVEWLPAVALIGGDDGPLQCL